MQIPKRIKIGGHTFTVHYEKPGELGQDAVGCNERGKNRIVIDSSMAHSQQCAVFFHELIHGINYELEEAEVEYLAQALYAALEGAKMLK